MRTMPITFKPLTAQDLLDMNITLIEEKKQKVIVPEHGYCIQCSVSVYRNYTNVQLDVFLNMCWSNSVDNAKTKMLHTCCHGHDHKHQPHVHHFEDVDQMTGSTKEGEHHWLVPYIVHRSHKDENVRVYDFIVGPQTFKRSTRDTRFRELIIQTAMESIEERFEEQFVRDNALILNGRKYMQIEKKENQTISKRRPIFEINEAVSRLSNIKNLNVISVEGRRIYTLQQREFISSAIVFPQMSTKVSVVPRIQSKYSYIDVLKLHIPECRIHQTLDYVTFFFYTDDIDAQSIQIFLNSDEKESVLEVTYLTKGNVEYGWYTKLPQVFRIDLSYASFSNNTTSPLVIVIRKQFDGMWPYPISI